MMMFGCLRSTKDLSRLILQRSRSAYSLLGPAGSRMAALKSPKFDYPRTSSPSSAGSLCHRFSSSASAAAAPKPADKPNLFLDNLGTIFLTVIGAIIASLVRSYYGTQNRNAIRDNIEAETILDPLEIDDLRTANSELTLQVYQTIMKDVLEAFPEGQCTYADFIRVVRQTMANLKGENFSVELGHLLDRAALGVMSKRGVSSDQPRPLALWLTLLSLALNAPVPERISLLYQVLQETSPQEENPVSLTRVYELVGYLQDTCQLVPDSQVVATDRKYPTQQYECGRPQQLVQWPDEEDVLDVDAVASILRSKSVCAWGECYHKKKFV